MPVTIKDIARQVEVSHSTVSRALNGSPLIAAETAERIRQTAKEMGYLRSAAARTLKTNRSQVLGVIISNVDDPFFSEILQGIEEVAQTRGYSLFMAASQRDPIHERLIIRTMREHSVDGIILCSTPFSAEQSRQLCSYGIPIIVINNQSDEEYRYSIDHDDLDGGRQVCRHLIGLGHRRIAYVGFPRSGRINLKRLHGYREEMGVHGLIIPKGYEYEAAASDPQSGCAAAAYFLSLAEHPTAIFCYNDMLAIGVLQGLQQGGLQVPQDCSLAGFDNITYSAYSNPPLTTFDQPKRFIGAEAARLVLDLLDGSVDDSGPDPKTRILQGKLLVRASTDAPA